MSCLFDSLSHFVNQSSTDLRHNIVSYLQTNPKLMNDVTFNEIMSWENANQNDYLNAMNQTQTWGGAIEIKAFVNMFRVNVVVHIPAIQKMVEFVYDDVQKQSFPFIHILWTGNHFVPLRSRN